MIYVFETLWNHINYLHFALQVRNNDNAVSSDDFYISLVRLMDSLFTEVDS